MEVHQAKLIFLLILASIYTCLAMGLKIANHSNSSFHDCQAKLNYTTGLVNTWSRNFDKLGSTFNLPAPGSGDNNGFNAVENYLYGKFPQDFQSLELSCYSTEGVLYQVEIGADSKFFAIDLAGSHNWAQLPPAGTLDSHIIIMDLDPDCGYKAYLLQYFVKTFSMSTHAYLTRIGKDTQRLLSVGED